MAGTHGQASARKESAQATRARILEAAVRCFAQQGFDRTSTATIAKEAAVSQGIIFHHFGTKDGLFASIVRDGVAGFTECVRRAEESQLPPAGKIQLLLRAMGEMALAEPARTDIIIRQVFQMPIDPERVADFGVMQVISTIAEAFEAGKQSGAFSDVDVQTAALSILGIYLANYVGWAALGKSFDFVHALEQACSMFLEGVVRPTT